MIIFPAIEYDDLLDYCLDQPVFVRLVQTVPEWFDPEEGDRTTVEHFCMLERIQGDNLNVRLSIPGSWSYGPVDVCDLDITEVHWSDPDKTYKLYITVPEVPAY